MYRCLLRNVDESEKRFAARRDLRHISTQTMAGESLSVHDLGYGTENILR